MELPKFKYHPNPLATGAIAESNEVCECCEEAPGYIYKASFYSTEEVESICPWCIADGSAAEKYECASKAGISIAGRGFTQIHDQPCAEDKTGKCPERHYRCQYNCIAQRSRNSPCA